MVVEITIMKTNKMWHFVCGVLATYGLVVACGNMDKYGEKYSVKIKLPSGDVLENQTVWDTLMVYQLAEVLKLPKDAKLLFNEKFYPQGTLEGGLTKMKELGVKNGDTLVFVIPEKSEEIKDEPKNKTNSSVGCNCFGLFQR